MGEQNQQKSSQIIFEDFDKLKLKERFAEDLFQNMESGVKSPIGDLGRRVSWTISLNAEFGNGKTTFLKMFEHFIQSEKQNYNVVFINAWESDFYGKPVMTILSELAMWIDREPSEKLPKIEEAVSGIKKALVSVVSQAVQHKTGVDIKKIREVYKDQKQILALGENILKDFEEKKEAIQKVKEAISEYIKTSQKKLLIIVDELDRARPDYAVRFLEDIKHFFDIENVVFLVAVNRQQMETTVKCLYGRKLDFDGYYRKFFKQEKELPDPYEEAQGLVDDLIKKTEVKFNDQEVREHRVGNSYLSCKMFKLTLREVESFVRIFEMILGHEESIIKWIRMDAYSFFICLFLKRKDVFQKILKGDFNVDKFISFIKEDQSLSIFFEGDKTEYYKENLLLRVSACSFLAKRPQDDEEKQQLKKDKKRIEEHFPISVSQGEVDRAIRNFFEDDPRDFFIQPAFKICETISKCQSAFSQ